ncbi:MAG: SDR family oxidoreductase [Chitinophagaceae bacterium]|nr:MAG: SDR family oxidoreductase [Chitinophagaceae bacterium]
MNYILITGASKGIGLSIARSWAARGFNVLLVARGAEALETAAAAIRKDFGVQVDFRSEDLGDAAAPQRLLDWCRSSGYAVQGLVNNAGFGSSGAFTELPLEGQQNMMQVNMNALVALTHLFLPELKKQPKAWLLNIASSAAYQAVPFLSIYAATKAFVLTFSRGLRYELRDSSVSVTCVCPGSTDTDFANRAQVGPKAQKAAEKVNMTPEAVAEAAVKATLQGRAEVITGAINKLGAFLVWLFPKSLAEKTAAGLYK